MRDQYTNQLKELNTKLIKMGTMVQDIIEVSIRALTTQDLELAKMVYELDDRIDEMDLKIEIECMQLIALQSPLAKDLRFIGTILKINTDLERMGDYAVNIAKVTLEIGKEPFIKPLEDIPKMAKLAQAMVTKSLNAFTTLDIDLAREVALDDDAVDEIYEIIYSDLINKMIEEQVMIQQATRLIFIGRYLERIADHATNIGERVIYIVTGEIVEIN